jgi:hypothetical protein
MDLKLSTANLDLTTVVCRHVLSRARPVAYFELENGVPQATCGMDDHMGHTDGAVMCLGHVLEWTPTLLNIEEMPDNHLAELNEHGHWIVSALPE